MRSRTDSPLALATACRFSVTGAGDVDRPRGLGPDGDLLHVEDRARVEHGAPLGQGDHRDGVAPPQGGEGGALHGIDGDVGLRRCAVADPLAVVEHRRLVLLALADDDDAVHRHGVEDRAHGVDGRAVGAVLVPSAHPPGRGHRRGLGDPDELEGEVAIGLGHGRHGSAARIGLDAEDDGGHGRPMAAGWWVTPAVAGRHLVAFVATGRRAGPAGGRAGRRRVPRWCSPPSQRPARPARRWRRLRLVARRVGAGLRRRRRWPVAPAGRGRAAPAARGPQPPARWRRRRSAPTAPGSPTWSISGWWRWRRSTGWARGRSG